MGPRPELRALHLVRLGAASLTRRTRPRRSLRRSVPPHTPAHVARDSPVRVVLGGNDPPPRRHDRVDPRRPCRKLSARLRVQAVFLHYVPDVRARAVCAAALAEPVCVPAVTEFVDCDNLAAAVDDARCAHRPRRLPGQRTDI